MAEVSQKVGDCVYKLCSFKTNRAFLITSRSRVSVFGACFNLRTFEKHNEESGHKGKQMARPFCTILLRVFSKYPRCPAARIISRPNRNNISPLHRSKTAYYDILRVTSKATQAQIKTAYYRQSFRYHPDRNSGNDEAVRRFFEISEAYTVLGCVSLRKKYDRGVLSLADIQSAATPSRKDMGHPLNSEHQRSFRNTEGKPMFDFDAFYQAHYGEQLQREQSLRRWKERRQKAQQEDLRKWKLAKGTEMAVGTLLLLGIVFLFTLKS